MAKFHAGDRDWQLRLTVGLLTRIKREIGLDLAGILASGEQFAEILFADPEKLVEALWLLCESQAEAASITPEQFAGLFGGEELDLALEAMIEAAVDFFPKARGRKAIRKNLPRVMTDVETEVNREIEARMDAWTSSRCAGNSPAS